MNLTAALDRWLFRLRGPEPAPIVLVQRRVFVLPTAAGVAYVGVLLLMLAGSINYNLSLGYMLTFLLAGLGVVAILHTFNNLAQMRIAPSKSTAVFAGSRAEFELLLDNPSDHPRYAVTLALRGEMPVNTDIPAEGDARITLSTPAPRRGWQRPGRVTVSTRYPLGLIRAWSYVEPDMRCLVYPTPEASPPPLPSAAGGGVGILSFGYGSEDFTGLRVHQPADSPRHVAWKAVAREGPDGSLKTKQFSGATAAMLWLDWDAMPPRLDDEARLSRLTAWVLEAQREGRACGLRLPQREIPPASDDTHFHACLEALACHGQANGQ